MVWQLHRPLLWPKSWEEIRPDLHSLCMGCSQVLAPTSQALKWSGCMLQPNSPLCEYHSCSHSPTGSCPPPRVFALLAIAQEFFICSGDNWITCFTLGSNICEPKYLWAWGLSWPLGLNCNQLSSNLLPPLQLHHLPIISHNTYSFFYTKWFLNCHILEFPFKAEPIMKD